MNLADSDAIVECHSGYAYAERPVAFLFEGRRYQVAEVLERWRSPQGKGFRVRTTDDQIFELLYLEQGDIWRVHQP